VRQSLALFFSVLRPDAGDPEQEGVGGLAPARQDRQEEEKVPHPLDGGDS